MINLLAETKKAISDSGHHTSEIVFIGSEGSGHRCSWRQFESLADVEYDNGYGGQLVARDLVIVFSDGHKMWRGEYDGSEWWEFSKPPNIPKASFNITSVLGGLWATLKEINSAGGE